MAEQQLVVFGLGKEEFGIDIGQVREIVRLQNITEIPQTFGFAEGIINLRGQIVPIVDLCTRFVRCRSVTVAQLIAPGGYFDPAVLRAFRQSAILPLRTEYAVFFTRFFVVSR